MPDTKQFVCETCQKSFSRSSLLLRHSLVHNKTAAKFRCLLCSRRFTQKVTLVRHLKDLVCKKRRLKQPPSPPPPREASSITTKNNLCVYCDKKFLKPSDIERHIRTHTDERSYVCTKANCDKAFKLKNTLDRHLTTHDKKTFTCIVCSSTYMSEKTLHNHMRIHRHTSFPPPLHDFIVEEEIYEEITDNESIPLSDLLCDPNASSSPLNSSTSEINHVDIGSEETVEVMELQVAVERDDETLAVQQRSPSKNEHVCGTCGKSFKKPIDLQRHIDAVHDKKRPFKCFSEHCDKSFSLKCTLKRHQETHKDDRKLVTCNRCFKVLSSQSSLELHMRIHRNLKPHKCVECTLTFRTPGNLKSHLKTHSKQTAESSTNALCNFVAAQAN